MKTTKEQRQAVEQYILSCIDTSGYDDIQRSEKDRLQFVYDTFKKEYGHQMRYYGNNEQRTFEEWLKGLPSVFNIDFENYHILKLGREWGFLGSEPSSEYMQSINPRHNKMIERAEDRFLAHWWSAIYMKFKSMLTRPLPKKYERKTSDEFEIQGCYGQGWECVTTEETRKEARERLKEYRENEPSTPFRLIVKRIKKMTLASN